MTAKLTDGEFQQFVIEHFEKISAEFSELRAALKEAHEDITQMGRVLKPLSDAFDKDAETIVELDRRVARVEKHLEISRT